MYGWLFYLIDIHAVDYINTKFLYLNILMFVIAVPPFIQITLADLNDEEASFRESITLYINHFGLLFLTCCIGFIVGFGGSFLFFIPTLVVFVFLLLFPLFMKEKETIQSIISRIFTLCKSRWLDILIFTIWICLINLLVWVVSLNLLNYFEINNLTVIFLRIVINLILYPYLYILLVRNFHPSFEGQEEFNWNHY